MHFSNILEIRFDKNRKLNLSTVCVYQMTVLNENNKKGSKTIKNIVVLHFFL